MTDAVTALADIQANVAAELTVEQSAITLLQTLSAEITAANGVSPDAVEALAVQVKANADALAAAVAANTPPPPAS